MNPVRWISVALWISMLALWVTWYVKGRQRVRLWRVFGVLLLAQLLGSVDDFFPNTNLGRVLLVLSVPLMVVCFVLMVQEVRTTWREQMERVKHL
ncbi:MAG TPA: hypothetical protein VFV75_20430 [Candidatus Polarisedimenticolaceae bacterium]|nr:hypothetical protein [Candidatus Polarisedimenticolaceae bacterium]